MSELITQEFVSGKFPPRKADANKGSIGRGMLICGSYLMPGAAVIAATGAVNSGIGLLTLAFPESIYTAITAHLTEPVLLPCKAGEDGRFSKDAVNGIIAAAKKLPAVAIGCGLGISNGTRCLVTTLIENYEGRLILDADALNIVAEDTSVLKRSRAEIGITPHPGEMSRLTGLTIEEIQKNREKTASDFAKEYGVTVLLKGQGTVIATPDGDCFINPTGCPAMARGGSGDLLTGIALSFCAQGLTVADSLKAAAFVHGKAGERAAQIYGEMSATVMRIAGNIDIRA